MIREINILCILNKQILYKNIFLNSYKNNTCKHSIYLIIIFLSTTFILACYFFTLIYYGVVNVKVHNIKLNVLLWEFFLISLVELKRNNSANAASSIESSYFLLNMCAHKSYNLQYTIPYR